MTYFLIEENTKKSQGEDEETGDTRTGEGSRELLQKRGGEHAVSPRTGPGNIAKSVCLACLDVGSIKPRAFFRLLERRSRE